MILQFAGSPGFDAAWRALPATAGLPPAIPAAVAYPECTTDVVSAIELARAEGMRITVRSGGHSLCGRYVQDGVLVLDLRRMSYVTVDPELNRALVGPGTTSLTAALALDAAGAAFPVGHSPAVGLGGFLLAGGNGCGSPFWGPASHRIVNATVVGGDGRIRRADTDPELLWAIRGAGATFPGVVTEFALAIEPAVTMAQRATVTVPATAACHLGRSLDEIGSPNSVELTVLARPHGGGGSFTVVATGLTAPGPPSAAEKVLDELDLGTVSTRDYPGMGSMLADTADFSEDVQLSDHRWASDSWRTVLSVLPMDLPTASPHSSLLVAPAPPPRTAQAIYGPGRGLGVSGYAHLPADAGPDQVAGLTSWLHQALSPLDSTERYIGEADLRPQSGGLVGCLPPDALIRLNRLRARLDPNHILASPPC